MLFEYLKQLMILLEKQTTADTPGPGGQPADKPGEGGGDADDADDEPGFNQMLDDADDDDLEDQGGDDAGDDGDKGSDKGDEPTVYDTLEDYWQAKFKEKLPEGVDLDALADSYRSKPETAPGPSTPFSAEAVVDSFTQALLKASREQGGGPFGPAGGGGSGAGEQFDLSIPSVSESLNEFIKKEDLADAEASSLRGIGSVLDKTYRGAFENQQKLLLMMGQNLLQLSRAFEGYQARQKDTEWQQFSQKYPKVDRKKVEELVKKHNFTSLEDAVLFMAKDDKDLLQAIFSSGQTKGKDEERRKAQLKNFSGKPSGHTSGTAIDPKQYSYLDGSLNGDKLNSDLEAGKISRKQHRFVARWFQKRLPKG